MKLILGLSFCFLVSIRQISFAQNDTLVSFDVRSRTIKIIPPQIYDKSKISENTQWNIGSLFGLSNLPLTKPSIVFPGAGFTDFTPAQKLFSVSDYPIRTAVKIIAYKNGQSFPTCSGILVSKDLVLTASHCLFNIFDSTNISSFIDSVLVIPGFDNGKENQLLSKSFSSTYIIPKINIDDYYLSQDVALIKVREPIGLSIGWIGISFYQQDSSLKNKVLHKFSYPGTIDRDDSTRIFNGDTLYYNYGILDVINKDGIGYNINGIEGQSGSSLFLSDNVSYFSIGVLNWQVNSMHYRFSRPMYYAFKNIIQETQTGIAKSPNIQLEYSISNAYPNPFNPTTSFVYSLKSDAFVKLELIDILGRHVQYILSENKSKGIYTQSINAENLPSGIYFLRFCANEYYEIKKIILLK